jgi:excisionase family DNA binding protein
MITDAKQYLNSRELAELLGVSLRTVVNLRRRRQIPYIQMGHVIRYKRDAVESALMLYTIEGIASAPRNKR